ncbi:hypothetical protein ACWFRB_09320 [Rhodococcus sp. NPDC055112]
MARIQQTDTPTQVLEAFVLRARRILEHSLIRDHQSLMRDLYSGKLTLDITENRRTGEVTQVLRQTFPPEELIESFAARLRPLILPSERLHFQKVFDAIEALLPEQLLANLENPISWWRDQWASVVDRSPDADAQAFLVITDRGSITDGHLMYAWLYSDLVHADDAEGAALGLSIDERFRGAAGVLARIGSRLNDTYGLVKWLYEEGVLRLDPGVFERAVVVSSEIFEQEIKMHRAEVDTPIPTDLSELDPAVWTSGPEAFRPTEPAGQVASQPDGDTPTPDAT